MSKKNAKNKTAIIKGLLVGSAALALLISKTSYVVTKVVDGDTFVTKENQYVRLDSVNAPDLAHCLGKEAKAEMEKLVLNRRVFLKVVYVDSYQRLISSVYTLKGNVGEMMLKKGLAEHIDKNAGPPSDPTLPRAEATARVSKIGIFSPLCTQYTNLKNSACNIKGNIVQGKKTYHYPGCPSYGATIVQLYLGDQWFCTKREAADAGYTRAANCY